MKSGMLVALMVALLFALSGCTAVEGALGKLGDDMEQSQLDTPENNGGDIDWSFVPVVREMACETFLSGFPEAEIVETSVASKNGANDRVIVTISYDLNGKTGDYGFDYTRNDQGEYELTRYGDGANSDDLH